jgi:hypothetical protein
MDSKNARNHLFVRLRVIDFPHRRPLHPQQRRGQFRLREKIEVFGAVPRASIRPTGLGPAIFAGSRRLTPRKGGVSRKSPDFRQIPRFLPKIPGLAGKIPGFVAGLRGAAAGIPGFAAGLCGFWPKPWDWWRGPAGWRRDSAG